MTTAKQLRASVTSCVDEAIKDVPGSDDVAFRLRCFVAYLSGELAVYREDDMVAALRKLVGQAAPCNQSPAEAERSPA